MSLKRELLCVIGPLWRGALAIGWALFHLLIWIAALAAVSRGWWEAAALLLLFFGSAFLAQFCQDRGLWSGRLQAVAGALKGALWRTGFVGALANLAVAAPILGLIDQALLQLWAVEVTPFLAMVGLATSIQCLHWRNAPFVRGDIMTPPVFFDLARDFVAALKYLQRRNRDWQSSYPLRPNSPFLDQARRDSADAGQGPGHLQ
ncbi:MAG: hypothetical protein IPK59_19675 [Rhodospirillaceae bacterium]|nr:hypothetical protein [Rhodospirillaceae bacterium]